MSYRWFFVAVLALLLALPRPATAQDEQWHGVLSARPTGVAGAWVVGERTFTATSDTTLREEHGPLEVGACVLVTLRGDVVHTIASAPTEACEEAGRGDDDGRNFVSRTEYITGILSRRPEGVAGEWVVNDRTATATDDTTLHEEHGPLEVGVCATLEVSGEWAMSIASEPTERCAGSGGNTTPPPDISRWIGRLVSRPEGISGTWEFDTRTVTAIASTQLVEEHGPLAAERCAMVHLQQRGAVLVALRIESQPDSVCEGSVPPSAPAPEPTPPPADARCFDEVPHCISGRIREYWEQNGGLPVFGFPITPQQQEVIEGEPYTVQWFERNRLELHPENDPPYDVLLGRLGVDVLERQGRDWFGFPRDDGPQEGCRFSEETGYNVCGDILEMWRSNGLEIDGEAGTSDAESLALFGLPVSPPMRETLHDGQEYTVQWFERARFELHPENDPPYHVLLGLLGNELSQPSE